MRFFDSLFIQSVWLKSDSEIVFSDGKRPKTRGELKRSAEGLAQALHERGVIEGDRVIMAIVPGWSFLVSVYALLLLGAEMALIDPEMGEENYREKLRQLSAQWAIVDRRILFLEEHPILKWIVSRKVALPSFKGFSGKVISIGPGLPLLKRVERLKMTQSAQIPSIEWLPSDLTRPTFIVYTSGTVASPKGVSHSLGSMGKSIELLGELLQSQGAKHLATHLPHYQLLGVNSGVSVSIWNPRATPKQKLEFIQKNRVTTLFGPPSDFLPLLEYIESRQIPWPESLTRVYFGSAPVHVSFLQRWFDQSSAPECTCLYGMTENLMCASIDGKEKLKADLQGDLLGYPFPGVDFRVNEEGELELQSEQMFAQYLGLEPHSGWYSTGDYGQIDEHGRIVLKGRKKDMIIRGNFNIYPSLYESTIEKIEGVDEAVLIGYYAEEKADEVVVLVVDGATHLTSDFIFKKLQSGPCSIDKAAIPDVIYFRTIPRSGRSGKADKGVLREWVREKS